MAVSKARTELSQDDFMRLQKEGNGFELEHGRLIELMPVDVQQCGAWGEVYLAIGTYARQNRCGRAWLDVLTYLDPAGKVRYFPDIAYLDNEALHRSDGRKIVGPPTLVVEVTTPDSDEREEGTKKANYHGAGVPWYWVVNTVRWRLEEYRREPEEYVLVSETPFDQPFRPALFPGLEIVVAREEP